MDPSTILDGWTAGLEADVTGVATGAVAIGLGVFALKFVIRKAKSLVSA